MAKKYIAVRMPLTAYNNFMKRKERIELTVKKITKRVIRVPLTKVFEISAENSITLPDEYLFGKLKKRGDK